MKPFIILILSCCLFLFPIISEAIEFHEALPFIDKEAEIGVLLPNGQVFDTDVIVLNVLGSCEIHGWKGVFAEGDYMVIKLLIKLKLGEDIISSPFLMPLSRVVYIKEIK